MDSFWDLPEEQISAVHALEGQTLKSHTQQVDIFLYVILPKKMVKLKWPVRNAGMVNIISLYN